MIFPNGCALDDDCGIYPGYCQLPGGRCWHALNVDEVDLDKGQTNAEDWGSLECWPGPPCTCLIEEEPIDAACTLGKCTLVY
jgi:hypothetical protein